MVTGIEKPPEREGDSSEGGNSEDSRESGRTRRASTAIEQHATSPVVLGEPPPKEAEDRTAKKQRASSSWVTLQDVTRSIDRSRDDDQSGDLERDERLSGNLERDEGRVFECLECGRTHSEFLDVCGCGSTQFSTGPPADVTPQDERDEALADLARRTAPLNPLIPR